MKIELLAITPNVEKLIEEAGRTCYMSFDKKTSGSEKKFIQGLVKAGHTSVLEHGFVTFRIKNASRSFTHQLVRHRLCAFSQQSQRYVNEKNFTYITPDKIEKNPEAKKIYSQFFETARDVYMKLQALNIINEDARYVLPNAVCSEIVFSTNFRELRHIFQVRGAKRAQWEIREACVEMLKIIREKVPSVFGDFVIDEKEKTITKE
ncbi:MAG: FAD-dependent thymidylate synthase [Elusimicrobia bacterium]|nr:FAD-dependent thymidylate synthase [Elusimicrobiota bacterium]